jgi:hypothetical protein
MMGRELFGAEPLFVEFTVDQFKIADHERLLALPVERQENGRLALVSRQLIALKVREFLKARRSIGKSRVFCSVPISGVSMRQFTLPLAEKTEFDHLLLLQIEKEFPISPEELFWGFVQRTGNPQELAVFGARRDAFEQYSSILADAGCLPEFTVGAVARAALAGPSEKNFVFIELGEKTSEMLGMDNGLPSSLRVLPGFTDFDGLVHQIEREGTGKQIFIGGEASHIQAVKSALPSPHFQEINLSDLSESSAIAGMKKAVSSNQPLLILDNTQARELSRPERLAAQWKWPAIALVLGLACLAMNYAHSSYRHHRLIRQYTRFKAYRESVPDLDRQLGFLEYLKTNQPPYLDAIFALAGAAPRGVHTESLSINRRGEISFKGGLRDAQQMVEFRSRLIESGAFSNVIVEEQTPTPDHQKLNVRITAQLNSAFRSTAPALSKTNLNKQPTPNQNHLRLAHD